MRALTGFLKALCSASHGQLFSRSGKSNPVGRVPTEQEAVASRIWWPGSRSKSKSQTEIEQHDHPDTSLLLTRIGDVMLKCIRSGRPLIHIMRAWSIVGPHFMEVCILSKLSKASVRFNFLTPFYLVVRLPVTETVPYLNKQLHVFMIRSMPSSMTYPSSHISTSMKPCSSLLKIFSALNFVIQMFRIRYFFLCVWRHML